MKLIKITLTRQSESAGQGFLDRAEVMREVFPTMYGEFKPGKEYIYGFSRPWIIESVQEIGTLCDTSSNLSLPR